MRGCASHSASFDEHGLTTYSDTAKAMVHFKRVMTEQMTQVVSLATGFIDRIVLTAALFRFWGAPLFETWSVCVALAGLVSLFEFGFTLYFNNRLMFETEQGRPEIASHFYFLSNTIMGASASAGFIFIVGMVHFYAPQGEMHSEVSSAVVLILAAGITLRIAVGGSIALYRANRQYARLVMILTAGEAFRIFAALAAVLLGGELVAVSIASTAAVTAVQVGFILYDSSRRFAPHRIGFALPSLGELGEVLSMSTAFFAQMVPIILLTSIPVLFVRSINAEVGLLAGFVLMRTMSGLPRILLQSMSIVLGQECGRRLAVKDLSGALAVISEGARLFAVLSGLMTGILVGGGREIIYLWTGSTDLFRQDQFLAAVMPMALVATSVLAHNVLAASNAPYLAAGGRWAQLGLTAAFAIIAPVENPALRMLLALSFGEIIGFAPFAYYAVARLVPGTGLAFHAKAVLFTFVSAFIAGGTTYGILALIGSDNGFRTSIALALAAAVCGLTIPWLGLSRKAQRALVSTIIHPQLVRFGIGPQKAGDN
jgi:hypothetical protein